MSRQILILVEALFKEVLDRFDVVVSCSLNFFDTLSVLNRKIRKDLVHEGLLRNDLLDGSLILCDNLLIEQCLEPAKLDKDAEPHESILREVGAEGVAALGVSTIYRTDCCQGAYRRDLSGLVGVRECRHTLL